MNTKTDKILIRVDGHKRIGMGHIYEMLLLSNYMIKHYDVDVVFITRNNEAALNLIRNDQIGYYALPFNISRKQEIEEIRRIINIENPAVLILDLLRIYHDNDYMAGIRARKDLNIIVFTNTHSKKPINADIVFSLSLYQDEAYYTNDKSNKYYLGFDYIILPEEYLTINGKDYHKQEVERVMICMGGSDHNNLTFRILKATDASNHKFDYDLILNSSFFKKVFVDIFIKNLNHKVNIHYDIKGICNVLDEADMAVTAGGNTHIERMCSGVPGIVISQLKHQEKSVRKITEYGATINLGSHKQVSDNEILKTFDSLIENSKRRARLVDRGRKLIDGQGIKRVSQIIDWVVNDKGE